MATLLMTFSPPLATTISQISHLHTPVFPSPRLNFTYSRKSHYRIRSSNLESFLDFQTESKPKFLDFDLSWFDPSGESRFDVIIIGTGPAGLRLAEQLSRYGIKVCSVDPSPLSVWPNNYGVWADEFENMGLVDCLEKTWPTSCVFIDDHKTKYLDRPYGLVCRKKLKTKLMESCVSNGVQFHKAKVWKVDHEEFESSIACDDGNELRASLIVDASGFSSSFIEYDKPRDHGYQIAHGVLAEVDYHPFDLDKIVLMDWRDSHMRNEPNPTFPTFLFAMPFDSNLIFLEETSLVSRPALPYMEVNRRMVLRLRHLGIRVKRVIEDEKCLIPMGGPLPKMPQCLMAIGGNSGLVNPSTGYMVAQTMALAPIVAETIAECLGSTIGIIRGKPLYDKVWKGLWPLDRKYTREFYTFGMEIMLKLDVKRTRDFMDAFFDLDPHYLQGFLSSRLSLGELVSGGFSLLNNASNSSKFDIVAKCPKPFVRMMSNFVLHTIKSYY